MKLYGYIKNGALMNISNNKELLQEICMDDYFENAYHDWISHNFSIPEAYNLFRTKKQPEFPYISPNEWWANWNEPFDDWHFEVIDM